MRDDSVTLPEPTDPSPSDWLIGRYVAGDCTGPESVTMERWLAANPDWRHALKTMRVDGQVGRSGWHDTVDVSVADRKLLTRIGVQTNTGRAQGGMPRGVPRRRWGTMMVAGAFSLLAVTIATLATIAWPNIGRTKVAAVSTHTTGNGQRTTITLPDGSTVLLNVSSRLEVPSDYDRGNRTLRLDGEALFTVAHHQGRPFTVIAGPSTTRVLGTSFVVRHYATDTAALVAVRDGKVMVQSQILTMAQQILVGAHGMSAVLPASLVQFSFASGVLMFSGVSLPDAIPQLNRWYDADIRLGDSALTTQRVVGGFKAGSLTDLSALLEMMYNVHVVRDGRVLTLYPGKQ